MPNSSARRLACAASGSQMATSSMRGPSLRQAARWYQLIIPAPATATLSGPFRRTSVITLSLETEEPGGIGAQYRSALLGRLEPARDGSQGRLVAEAARQVDEWPIRAPEAALDAKARDKRSNERIKSGEVVVRGQDPEGRREL